LRRVLYGERCIADPESKGFIAAALIAAALGVAPAAARAQPVVSSALPPARAWISVPRTTGRITARSLGLVINTADPYSVEVGEYYAQARKIDSRHILRLELPLRASLDADEFEVLRARVQAAFGADVQGLALAWRRPYAVACNSITGALALGFDASLCSHTCAPSRRSPYVGSATVRPFSDLHLRPAMLLAARDVPGAEAMIDRGIASDGSLGRRGAPPVHAHFVTTDDKVRSVRSVLFPPPGHLRGPNIDVHLDATPALEDLERVMLYLTGRVRVDKLDTVQFVPGALADHLTSVGGVLEDHGTQMSILDWIDAGATASYGTVSEPCSHLQKFPHPQLLMLFYTQGSSALEAYWKSVAWPQQGVFIGEPLAAPFAAP
jgi:uncharacterized protein (TIGR03790 family)